MTRAFECENWKSSLSVKEHLSFGSVYVNGVRVHEDVSVRAGDLIKVHLIPKRYPFEKISFEPRLIFECDDFLVVDKPAGLPTHATSDNWKENLHFHLQTARGEKLFVTSRLDAETEGLLLYARTREALTGMNELFRAKQVEKTYVALTESEPPCGMWTHFQTNRIGLRKEFLSEARAPEDRLCQLVVREVQPHPLSFAATVQLITGRTHQIRGQFSLAGFPLIGDRLYGSAEDPRRLGLACTRLSFLWKGQEFNFQKTSTDK